MMSALTPKDEAYWMAKEEEIVPFLVDLAREFPHCAYVKEEYPPIIERMKQLAATNVLHLFASTFSDHVLPYFTPGYNQDNQVLAKEFLGHIYGASFDADTVFTLRGAL